MVSYGLEKERLIGTKAVNSLVMQITKVISYGAFGAMTLQIAAYGIALGIGAIVGVLLARKHLSSINTQQFRQYTMLLMFISGIVMLFKAI